MERAVEPASSTPSARTDARVLAARLVRPGAIAAVTLTLTAAVAATSGRAVPTGILGAIAVAAGLLRDRQRGHASAAGSASLVVGVVLLVVALRDLLHVDVELIDRYLLGSAAAFSVLAFLRTERRFASLAVLQLAIVVGRPLAGEGFTHCLFARSVTVPLPRLDGLLALGVLSVAVGLLARHLGAREAGRGYQVTGLAVALTTLVAKAIELPGLEILCGSGDATDPGWVAIAIVVGGVVAATGLRQRDLTLVVLGATAFGLSGFLATLLQGGTWWAAATAVPFVLTLLVADHLGVSWPPERGHDPGDPLAPAPTNEGPPRA